MSLHNKYLVQLGNFTDAKFVNSGGKIVREFKPLKTERFNIKELALLIQNLTDNEGKELKGFPNGFLSRIGMPKTIHCAEFINYQAFRIYEVNDMQEGTTFKSRGTNNT